MNEFLLYLQSHMTWVSIIEILIITFIIYQILMWLRGTQAEQVVKGIIFLMLLMPIFQWLGFTTLNFFIKNVFTWIFLLVIIVFQPELRRALEHIGSNGFVKRLVPKDSEITGIENDINEVVRAVEILSRDHTGALIICIGKTGLKNIAQSGTMLNAEISWELLGTIFTDKRPLHDGATIVDFGNSRVIAAGCVLPLTGRKDLESSLGTRHRAGIGISEQSDAFTIIVSEETGKISVTQDGEITQNITLSMLRESLDHRYILPLETSEDKKRPLFRTKTDDK